MFLDHRGPESIQLSSKPLCREDENQICSRNDISDNACSLILQSVSGFDLHSDISHPIMNELQSLLRTDIQPVVNRRSV